MRFRRSARILTGALLIVAVGGCAEPYYAEREYRAAPVRSEYRTDYGVVEAVDYAPRSDTAPSGLGAVVGGVAGGVAGHQIGSGRGNAAATIAGAIGGALIGNEVERRNRREDEDFRVTVRMDDGTYRSVIMSDDPNLRPGDRVVIDNGRVFRR